MTPQRPELHVVKNAAEVEAAATPLGDVDALFRQFAPYVAAIALRMLGRDSEVDDVVQDVFLNVHRGLSGLRDPAAIKGWLSTLTVRQVYGRLRRRRILSVFGFDRDVSEYYTLAGPEVSPERRQALQRIYRMLDTLSPNERLAWSLRHLENEKIEDVARLCGCSMATAKRRIASAHAKICEEV